MFTQQSLDVGPAHLLELGPGTLHGRLPHSHQPLRFDLIRHGPMMLDRATDQAG